MRFDIITIFPHIFDSYFNASIIGRAQKKKLIKIKAHDLRKWATDKHKTASPACATRKRCGRVDDKPYGGGPGMIFKVEPIFKAMMALKKIRNPKYARQRRVRLWRKIRNKYKIPNSKFKTRILLFSAKGKTMTQADARRWAKYDRLILICGRYEGVDERVAKCIADEEVSVGNYVLTGGEIPATIVVDAVSRLVPGVIKPESLIEESFTMSARLRLPAGGLRQGAPFSRSAFGGKKMGEYPQYTRPENFMGWKVPKILLSGDHKKIEEWKSKYSRIKKNSLNPKFKITNPK